MAAVYYLNQHLKHRPGCLSDKDHLVREGEIWSVCSCCLLGSSCNLPFGSQWLVLVNSFATYLLFCFVLFACLVLFVFNQIYK